MNYATLALIIGRSLRKDWRQLALTGLAITLAATTLLVFSAAFSGLMERSNRTAWHSTNSQQAQQPTEGIDPIYLIKTTSASGVWQGQRIQEIVVIGAEQQQAPTLPNFKLPQSGQFYASPALHQLHQQYPQANLLSRFGSDYVGVIPDQYVESPDSLTVVRGQSLDSQPPQGAQPIYQLLTMSQESSTGAGAILTGVMYTGVSIVLIPVILLLAIAIKVGSSQRANRYAALRLIGMTKLQIRLLLLVQTLIIAGLALALSLGLYHIIHPWLQQIHFLGLSFWPEDMKLALPQYALISLAVLLYAIIANWWGLRQVEDSPIGFSLANNKEKKPRPYAALPLILSLVGIVYVSQGQAEASSNILLLLASVVLAMLGLILVGPYITYTLSQLARRRAISISALLGASYIQYHARSVFRSVAGVVLALFAGTFYLVSMSGVPALAQQLEQANAYRYLKSQSAMIATSTSIDANLADDIGRIANIDNLNQILKTDQGYQLSCQQSHILLSDPPDCQESDWILVDFEADASAGLPYQLSSLPTTDGQTTYMLTTADPLAIEQVRTLLSHQDLPSAAIYSGYEVEQLTRSSSIALHLVQELAALAYVGIIFTVIVAAISLTISTVGGLLDRRRSLATLRLIGVDQAQQKRIVLLESLLPMIAVSILSVGMAIWYAQVFISTFGNNLTIALDLAFLVTVASSMAISALCISLSLRVLKDIAHVSSIRSE